MTRSASIFFILLSILFLTACEPSTTVSPTSPAPTRTAPPLATVTPFPSQTPTIRPTNTSRPTATVTATRRATATPAPLILPGMPGFQLTPTYDPALFPPATPSTPPPCPTVNPDLPFPADLVTMISEFQINRQYLDAITPALEYLNQGGAPNKLIQILQAIDPSFIFSMDFTNDNQAELVIILNRLFILGCSPNASGQYILLGEFIDLAAAAPPILFTIDDLNQNGFPELLLAHVGGSGTAVGFEISEWNGLQFQSALGRPPAYPYESIARINYREEDDIAYMIVAEVGFVELQDLDNNGTLELIVNIGITGHADTFMNGPWRGGEDILTWNGTAYVLLSSKIDPPIYRFQAVHDADQAALMGNYDEAVSLYQDVIFSDQLLGWSFGHYRQQREALFNIFDSQPTPTPLPAPAEEYFHLAAYARFRILVLHTLTGDLDSAQVVHDSLQEYYPTGQPGHASAQLATDYWQAFQSSGDVGQACNQSLALNPEVAETILPWISSDYHGWQSPRYELVDLCPFGQTGTRD